MELEELQAAILRNQQATGQMAGLDEQFARANALRDTPREKNDRYGGVNVLSGIANAMRRDRGTREADALAPQREAARDSIAAGDAAVAGEGMRLKRSVEKLNADKFTEEQRKAEVQETLKAKQDRESQAEVERLAAKEGDGEDWTSPDGKVTVGGGVNADGTPYIYVDGAKVDPQSLGYQRQDTLGGGMGVRGKAMSTTQRNNVGNRAQRVHDINRLSEEFEGKFAKVKNVPTEFANQFAMNLSKSDLMKLASESTDKEAKANAQWWADFKYNMLDRRHELFGATLTPSEERAWEAALLIAPGMDEEEIRKRLVRLRQSENERLIREANMGMTDPLESNRNAYSVGMEGVLEYDADTQRYSMPGYEKLLDREEVVLEPIQYTPTPEVAAAYAELTAEDIAELTDGSLTEEEITEFLLNRGNTPEVAPASVLPQANRQYGRGRPPS